MPTIKPVTYDEAMALLDTKKHWGNGTSIYWVQKSPKKLPSGFDALITPLVNGIFEEGLRITLYFKEASYSDLPDKFSASLMYRSTRICGLDTGGFSDHTNTVGKGRKYFQQTIEMPHLHTPSKDGVYGYAEPLPNQTIQQLWEVFLETAKIDGAPPLTLPNEGQTGKLL